MGDSPHDAIELQLGDLGTLEGVLIEGITDDVLLRPLLERLDELVVDAFLDVNPGTGAAALAVVEEDTKVNPGNGILDIRVVEDDIRTLPSQLKGHLLQVRPSGRLHDLSSNNSATSESDLVDIHVCGQSGTGDLSEAGDDVDDTGRESGFLDETCGVEGAEWGLLCCLHDDGVAAGDGGADLPCHHDEREVPRDDLSADADLRKPLAL